MIAKDLISSLIPPLKGTDTGDKALIWMHEFNVSQLPIIQKDKYLGLISEEDILDFEDPAKPLKDFGTSLFKPFVTETAHIYEVVKIVAESNLALMPVVDQNDNYIGVITLENIIRYFSEMSSINESGAIITLELNRNDYSLSEIARLVESNDVAILSTYVSLHKDSTKLEVTLKLNSFDAKKVVATFERFDYKVTGSFQEIRLHRGYRRPVQFSDELPEHLIYN